MAVVRNAYRMLLPERSRSWVRRNILTTEFQEVHIERIEQTNEKLFKWIRKHPETMLMPTFSIEEPTSEVLGLYSRLVSTFKNTIGLHVHISGGLYRSPPPPLQDFHRQYEIMKRGLGCLMKLGVETKDFTSGNWNYNRDTFLVCRDLGLTNVHIKLKEIPKITLMYGIPEGISLIPVARHLHDYDV